MTELPYEINASISTFLKKEGDILRRYFKEILWRLYN
jgi:hypothetical protein